MAKVSFYPNLQAENKAKLALQHDRRLLQTFALGLKLACSFFPVHALVQKVETALFGKCSLKFYSNPGSQTASEKFTGDEAILPSFPY